MDKAVVVVEACGIVAIPQRGPNDKLLRRRILDRCCQRSRVIKLVLPHQLDCLLYPGKIRGQLGLRRDAAGGTVT